MFEVQIIDGCVIVEFVCDEIIWWVVVLLVEIGKCLGLVVVLVGEDLVSQVYVCNKDCVVEVCGFYFVKYIMFVDVSEVVVLDQVEVFNNDLDIYGILVQLLLLDYIDESKVLWLICLEKDVDGFYLVNVGFLMVGECDSVLVFCILVGSLVFLKWMFGDLFFGKNVVVIG